MATALAAPNVAGYSFDQAPDLTDPQERRKLSENAIKVFVNIAQKWQLNEVQARGLLGGVASSTFHAWKTRPKGKHLDQDTLTRISLVIGIYKALNIYFGKPWADVLDAEEQHRARSNAGEIEWVGPSGAARSAPSSRTIMPALIR